MIHTINHVGIGIQDIDYVQPFYCRCLNFSFKLNDDVADLRELKLIFGDALRMRMQNSTNPRGGPGLELFEHWDTAPAEIC